MSSPTATAEPGRAPGDADPRRWVALAIVLIAGFMQLVDISIVNVAIPSIQRDLDATYSQIQWILAGYQLAFAVMLITGGRLVTGGFLEALRDPAVVEMASRYGDPVDLLESWPD